MSEFREIYDKVKVPSSLLILVFVIGTLGYKALYPEMPLLQLFFMTAVTLTTVGYEDILDLKQSPAAMIYTIVLMFTGLGVALYCISALTAVLVSGDLREVYRKRILRRKLYRMKDHFILCGAGKTGRFVVQEMHQSHEDFIIIDASEETVDHYRNEYPEALTIVGDATIDETLESANIAEAKGLVAALPNDKDNLFLTMSARLLNPNLKIVSKAIDPNMEQKLHNAGANYIVSTNRLGGHRIASEILRPHVVSFMDRMMRGREEAGIEEIVVPAGSPLIGHTLASAKIQEKTGIVIIAVSPTGKETDFHYNPYADTTLLEGAVLLFIGNHGHRSELVKLVTET